MIVPPKAAFRAAPAHETAVRRPMDVSVPGRRPACRKSQSHKTRPMMIPADVRHAEYRAPRTRTAEHALPWLTRADPSRRPPHHGGQRCERDPRPSVVVLLCLLPATRANVTEARPWRRVVAARCRLVGTAVWLCFALPVACRGGNFVQATNPERTLLSAYERVSVWKHLPGCRCAASGSSTGMG
jgi:hypothetical protein